MGAEGGWRTDLESFSFRPDGHEGLCVVHRRAFDTLQGRVSRPEECELYFNKNIAAFQQAAAAKISRACLKVQANFHLTSRDITRALRVLPYGSG